MDTIDNPHEMSADRVASAVSGANCKNCGAPLNGPWCGQCGQKHLEGPPSVGLFLEELISAFTHADSRFWRTLWALMVKPGFLAREYFDGRRARYLHPVRLYLGVSLLFFLFLSAESQLAPRNFVQLDADGSAATDQATQVPPISLDQAIPAAAKERLGAAREQIETETQISVNDDDICDQAYSGIAADQLGPRFQRACRQVVDDGGRALAQAFMAKLPTAMFVLMPLFALVMKFWYWVPKRYFTEHLILQINNHSAIFLVGLIANIVALPLSDSASAWITVGIGIYIMIYSYRSLGVYYGQSKWLTRFKYFSLMLVYTVLLITVLAFTGVASLFSVVPTA